MSLQRVPMRKASGPPSVPSAPAEPGVRTTLLMFTLDHQGKIAPYGSIETEASKLGLFTDAIEAAANAVPRAEVKMGRPGTKVLVTAINKADPDFPIGKHELGEVMTVPEVVEFFVLGDMTGDKLSAPLVQYYLKKGKPFIHRGYTFRALDDFKRDLDGPAAKDFHALANLHAEWCKANRRTPFE